MKRMWMARWVLVFASSVVATVAFADGLTPQALSDKVRDIRGHVRTLSHGFTRTYTPGDGAVVEGLFALDSDGNRRMDLGRANSKDGNLSSIYNRQGDFSSYDYEGISKREMTQASLHEPRLGTGTGGGVLDACYEILGEPLDALVARGEIVSESKDGIIVRSKLNEDVGVNLRLSKAHGYLCESWSAEQKDRTIRCDSEGWKPFGNVSLPTRIKIRVIQAGKPDVGHVDVLRSIEINHPVDALLALPKMSSGILVKDNKEGVLYRTELDGSLSEVGKIAKSRGRNGNPPLAIALATLFVASSSLAVYTTLKRWSSR